MSYFVLLSDFSFFGKQWDKSGQADKEHLV